jgi:hypothetical protein
MPNSIKDPQLYAELRKEGASKQKAARIANAAAAEGRSAIARRGGHRGSYADWTLEDLKARARELGLHGYSGLSKKQLIDELREHA